ncbi:hypothetical protein CLV90_2777 [Maribacter spongiicola]|uniref:Uncharacterized protein n=1 Tax=Maribacter spongiicola TaxID=1206753 RepID=A0A4R7JZI2_9FLAO|nr:hypothetical protein [Maribacter spongiicola]TDT43655.1 hypothetical protein CLV90_2777 [Maribacter spongiicola]
MEIDEQMQLRSLLVDMVGQWAIKYPNPVIKNHSYLNEDTSQFYTSEAELKVFKIDPKQLHRLHVAYNTYLGLIGVTDNKAFSNELYSLIIMARSLCPTLKYYGQEFPFTTGSDDPQTFTWYCKEFFDLPFRSSSAFWQKQNFNSSYLINYEDEQHIEILPPLRQDEHRTIERPIFSDWDKDPF